MPRPGRMTTERAKDFIYMHWVHLLSGRSEVRIPSGVPKERDIRKDVPFLWPPAAGNGCLPGNFKYPRADAVCASIRVISGRRR